MQNEALTLEVAVQVDFAKDNCFNFNFSLCCFFIEKLLVGCLYSRLPIIGKM
jgi:hypothetical protein